MGEHIRERMTSMTHDTFHTYALWARGVIVYVGYTSNLPRRLAQHYSAAWDDYEGFTVQYFATERLARDAEADMIRTFHPVLNLDPSKRRGYVPGRLNTCGPTERELAMKAVWEAHCAQQPKGYAA